MFGGLRKVHFRVRSKPIGDIIKKKKKKGKREVTFEREKELYSKGTVTNETITCSFLI